MVEQVAYWRRYCKFHDCTAPQVSVTVDAPPPVVNPDNPAIIAIVPIRPVSCGEFHYWNGSACVDARYNKSMSARARLDASPKSWRGQAFPHLGERAA